MNRSERIAKRIVAGFGGLSQFMKHFEKKYPGVELWISERGEAITLSQVVIPKGERKKGIGTAIMKALFEYADGKGSVIVLTPSSDYGGNKAKLKVWYSSLGFVKNKNYKYSETMIKYPGEE